MPESDSLLVLGLGNVLCGDDGLGVAAVKEIHRRYNVPESAQVLDGGTFDHVAFIDRLFRPS